MNRSQPCRASAVAVICVTACSVPICKADGSVEERLRALETQNEQLRLQLAGQQSTIEDLKQQLRASNREAAPPEASPPKGGSSFGQVHFSAEGGVGFFRSGSDGAYPNSSFRVDEARLYLESPVWNNTYFFSELNLVTREASDENLHLGEVYIDFENVLRHWTDQDWLSLRVGRMFIPFGEEYNVRYAIDNPLISHSLSDLWGVDEGIELYGKAHGFDYALAVQNGGHPELKDFNGDKSVAGRLGYNFGRRARLSFSGLRTGKLSTAEDKMSELWFGGGFFRSLGAPATTSTFQADVFELDAQTFWSGGHLKFAGGYFDYSDDDQAARHTRDGLYYYAEAMQHLTPKLYTAARFSQIHADKGMPIVGNGDFGDYFFGPLTRDLWRLSLGLGYKLSENLLVKLEYSFEQGKLETGERRGQSDFLGAELGFKF